MKSIRAILLVSIALLATSSTEAQVVREEGVKPIAGVLGGGYPTETLWIIKSSGNEIIFASLDAEVYRTGAQHGEEESHTPPDTGETGGHESGGGCSDDGGPGRFCVQVIDATGAVICQATRPAPPPGWQRDPRLACVLPQTIGQATYAIRVSLAGPEGSCTQLGQTAASGKLHPFVLNVSVRRVPASGVSVQQAIAISENQVGSSSCGGTSPVAGWICESGNWLPPDSPLIWTPSPPGVPVPPTPMVCAGSAPAVGWMCQDGNWLPPDHPLLRR